MRRRTKYLIIIGSTVIILLISCTLFYFNDRSGSLLIDSRAAAALARQGLVLLDIHRPVKAIGQNAATMVYEDEYEWKAHAHQEDTRVIENRNNINIPQDGDVVINMHRTVGTVSPLKDLVNDSDTEKGEKDLLKVSQGLKDGRGYNELQRRNMKPLSRNNPLFNRDDNGGNDVVQQIIQDDRVGESLGGRTHGGESKGNRERDSQFDENNEKENDHLIKKLNASVGRESRANLSLNNNSIKVLAVSYSNSNSKYHLMHPCSDPLCTEFLSERDFVNFTTCKRRTETTYSKMVAKLNSSTNSSSSPALQSSPWKSSQLDFHMTKDRRLLPSGECRFINGSGRSPVGLVSFPGSGNTWVRGLLQKATGICTGAVYCDRTLRVAGFDGEGIQSGSVLVVKTHSVTALWSKVKGQTKYGLKGRPFFDSAVLIVRNPFDALVSEWNRELSTKYRLGKGNGAAHTNSFSQEYFLAYPHWIEFVEKQIVRWRAHFDWLVKRPSNHSIIMVKYEDLQSDLVHQILKILKFLQFPYTYNELTARLSKDFVTFHRARKTSFEHYTSKQKGVVNSVIQSVSQRLFEAFGNSYEIEDYAKL